MKNFGKTKISSLKQISGFTLIELLVVIAVLGVLAAVVLVAINPSEQIARGRDSGRHSSVAQLAHAMTAYFTAQTTTTTYPVASLTWQQRLVDSKEITNLVTTPTTTSLCGSGAGQLYRQNNVCYSPISLNTGFVMWTLMESTQQSVRAGNGTACSGTNFPAAIYDSTQGKEGAACVASDWTAASITLY